MTRYRHAIVLGGSISGLLSAAALSSHFDRVTVVDRDALELDGPDALRSRRGVPQGDQVHHLLSLGLETIEYLLPGFGQELIDLGGEQFDDVADFTQYVGGAWKMRVKSNLIVTVFQRPLFEWAIRRRVLALPNVTVIKGMAVGLVGSEDGTAVIGAKVRGVDGGELRGDFVVDASGRGSRSTNWIQDLGYEAPLEQHVRIYMGYSTFAVRLPEGALPEGLAGIGVSASPSNPVGAAIRPCGGGLHDVVAYGMVKNYPPDDFDGIRDFFKTLSSPMISEVLEKAELVSEVVPYQMPGNQRRVWEGMSSRPERFVVVGDAVTSFNPIYGQGMTMASLDARVLGEAVASAASLDGVADAVQKGIGPFADVAWGLSVGSDSAYADAEYENVEPPSPRAQDWLRAFSAAQTAEGYTRVAARATALFMDTAYVDAPAVRQIVQRWVDSGRAPDVSMTDPSRPPAVSEGQVVSGELLIDEVA